MLAEARQFSAMLPSHAKPFSVAESMNACPAGGSLTREAFSQFTCLGAWVVPGGYAIRRLHCKACSKSTASRRIDGWAMRRMLPSCAKPFSQFTFLGSTVAPADMPSSDCTARYARNPRLRVVPTARQFAAMVSSRAETFPPFMRPGARAVHLAGEPVDTGGGVTASSARTRSRVIDP